MDFFQFRELLAEKIVQRTPRGGRFVKSEPKKTTRNVTSNIPKKSAEEKRAEETLEILSYFDDVGIKGSTPGFMDGSWRDTIEQHATYATRHEPDDEDGEMIAPHAAEKWEPVINRSKNLGKISVKVLKAANIKTRKDKFLLQVREGDLEDAGLVSGYGETHYLLVDKNKVSGNANRILDSMNDMFYLGHEGRKIQPKDLKSLTKYY